MRKIIELRPPSANADIFEADDVNSVYVDGVAAVQFTQSNSKIDFYVTETAEVGSHSAEGGMITAPVGSANGPPERRIVRTRITMPTLALLELFSSTLQMVKVQRPQLEAGFQTQNKRIFDLIDKLSQNV